MDQLQSLLLLFNYRTLVSHAVSGDGSERNANGGLVAIRLLVKLISVVIIVILNPNSTCQLLLLEHESSLIIQEAMNVGNTTI